MKHAMLLYVALCAFLFSGDVYSTQVICKKSPAHKDCPKQVKKKPVIKKQPVKPSFIPYRNIPKATATPSGARAVSVLTSKQSAMREAFAECIRKASPTDPTNAVVEFVFAKRKEREGSSIKAFWLALRGSTEHHGHEVCLTRAFALKGFRTDLDIANARGNLLVMPNAPHLEIPEDLVPKEQRLVRPWVSEYLFHFVSALRESARSDGLTADDFPTLRVTDMVRTFDSQARLVRRKLSPADCRYEFLCSSHTTGSSIDLGLRGVSWVERARIEKQLLADLELRKIFFIIENSHYHIFVLPPAYMGEE